MKLKRFTTWFSILFITFALLGGSVFAKGGGGRSGGGRSGGGRSGGGFGGSRKSSGSSYSKSKATKTGGGYGAKKAPKAVKTPAQKAAAKKATEKKAAQKAEVSKVATAKSTPEYKATEKKLAASVGKSGKKFTDRGAAKTDLGNKMASKKYKTQPATRPDHIPANRSVGGVTYNTTFVGGSYGYYGAGNVFMAYLAADMLIRDNHLYAWGYSPAPVHRAAPVAVVHHRSSAGGIIFGVIFGVIVLIIVICMVKDNF